MSSWFAGIKFSNNAFKSEGKTQTLPVICYYIYIYMMVISIYVIYKSEIERRKKCNGLVFRGLSSFGFLTLSSNPF